MSVTDELLQNAEQYAAAFDKGDLPLPPGEEGRRRGVHGRAARPARTCSASSEGDAHVIRNAGGVVTDDEIRSLAISQRLLGTEEIILIHHTDCGMLTFSDDDFRRHIQEETGRASRSGRPRPSPTSRTTCASRSRASRPARSSRRRTTSAGSSTTSTRGAWTK